MNNSVLKYKETCFSY